MEMSRPLAEDLMTTTATRFVDVANPLDRVERLAERKAWALDRLNEYEIVMSVSGGWCDLQLSLSWIENLELMQAACSFDLKVPEPRQTEVMRLVCLVNARLHHGHFDIWPADGHIVFRDAIPLEGGAEATEGQCDQLIRDGLDNCQRYYPAIQLVIWAGQTAEQALDNALIETMGEA
jgi:hypothetical protein